VLQERIGVYAVARPVESHSTPPGLVPTRASRYIPSWRTFGAERPGAGNVQFDRTCQRCC
jgi:hypothetical protein